MSSWSDNRCSLWSLADKTRMAPEPLKTNQSNFCSSSVFAFDTVCLSNFV